jgi:MFS family permease
VIRTLRASAPCTPASGPWVLAATIIGSAMAFIDGTVTNVALPQIQDRLGATAVDAQWIVEAYSLFLAALILVGGSLGELRTAAHLSARRHDLHVGLRRLGTAYRRPRPIHAGQSS